MKRLTVLIGIPIIVVIVVASRRGGTWIIIVTLMTVAKAPYIELDVALVVLDHRGNSIVDYDDNNYDDNDYNQNDGR